MNTFLPLMLLMAVTVITPSAFAFGETLPMSNIDQIQQEQLRRLGQQLIDDQRRVSTPIPTVPTVQSPPYSVDENQTRARPPVCHSESRCPLPPQLRSAIEDAGTPPSTAPVPSAPPPTAPPDEESTVGWREMLIAALGGAVVALWFMRRR